MLIDWITARLDDSFLPPETWRALQAQGDRIVRFSADSGDVVWETSAWDSIRSDSHTVAFRVGSDSLWIQGSPARVCGTGCAVFGSDSAQKLDLVGCVESMRKFVGKQIGVILPHALSWAVTRIDVTGNLLLDSLSDVRAALLVLRGCEGGRYRVSQQAGDTVYWSHKSRIRKGKAYAKGPHLLYQANRKGYEGKIYSPVELNATDRLLRLELTLGSQWLRRNCVNNSWSDLTAHQLTREWESYFNRMVGDAMITNDYTLKERIQLVAPTEGQARAAYGCWLVISSEGWERAQQSFSKTSWYRHLNVLRAAGLGDADLSAGTVVQFRRRILEAQLVNDWSELLAA